MFESRPYQLKIKQETYDAWSAGHSNVLIVLPCGGGKTHVFCELMQENEGASVAIAHRQHLVLQMSLTLAENGVFHRIIAPQKIISLIVAAQIKIFGTSFYDPSSRIAVAGVDTLIRRKDHLTKWLRKVTLCVIDEGHHVLGDNKWGEAATMFPNARVLSTTATPYRADKKGLGRHADGIIDKMIVGPTMRELIDAGYLTDYRIVVPRSNFDRSVIPLSKSTGDLNLNATRDAVAKSSLVVADDKSRIVGDIVQTYLDFAPGKLGITFMPDVATAERVAAQFNDMGVPARIVHAKTPADERFEIMRLFKARQILQIVNVDLLGEGTDVPACEVVSMGRPTDSFGLFYQQFCRALRLFEGKTRGMIIDHVGNVAKHGLPDSPQPWTLDSGDKRRSGDSGAIPTRTCTNETCLSAYERYKNICPFCGTPVPAPDARNGPEFVDGDLFELDAETLAALRGQVNDVLKPVDQSAAEYRDMLIQKSVPRIGVIAHTKRFIVKKEAQQINVQPLRELMAWWAGHHRSTGKSDAEIYRIFYITFGMDWLTAQTIDGDAMNNLSVKIFERLGT